MTENNLPKNTDDSDDIELLDKVNALPAEKKEEVIAKLEMYSGPIPHPAILKGYEDLYPGAAKAIIDNGVAESNHRRSLETKRQRRRGHLAYWSLIGGMIMIVLFIGASVWLISTGHTFIGSIFAGGGFLAMMGTLFDMVPQLTSNNDLNSNEVNKKK